ncbi:MAG: 30S ribosomal protein S16 [Bdellovibrionaceae bacterium]|nr:30S ribosomal protein S16 [Pseudobdellovibrionaceae bacterium]
MVVIRLARFGKKHSPRYRITVADSRRWLNGKFIEIIGHYNPNPQGAEKEFSVDMEKVQSWIAKGAQPSDRMKSLLRKAQAKT